MPAPRRLVLVRHAKATPSGPTDEARELAARGRADAAVAGPWLAAKVGTPDHALVSAAVRTRQTWETLAEAAGWEVEADYDEGLYAAGPETALDLVRAVPADCRSLVVVGHSPTIGQLAVLLDDGEGDVDAASNMVMGFPTCGIAVMSYDGAWVDLDAGSATVEAFHVGRGS